MSVKSFFATVPTNILVKTRNIDLNIKSENCNREINKLLQKTVLVGGKRLRPLLTYLMGNLFNLSTDQMYPFAKAIELVHAASLSHDDVVDNATTRRGIPSINVQASNQKAVLAGDYLLAEVIVELTAQGNLEIVQEMAQVISSLAEGEWIQLDAIDSRDYSRELIEKIALCKTASVMSFCCLAPAYINNSSAAVLGYCRSFGENLGTAFQLMDDTLDFAGSSKKDHHLDLKNGIVNSVVFEWLKLNPELMIKFKKGEEIWSLFDENHLDEAISIVKERANSKLKRAEELLEIIISEIVVENTSEEHKRLQVAAKPLLGIINYLGQRDF